MLADVVYLKTNVDESKLNKLILSAKDLKIGKS